MASKVSLERYGYNVLKLSNYILPTWEDKQYITGVAEAGKDPFKLHKTIIQLLNRRNFFKRKDLLEEIEGLPEPICSPTGFTAD